MFSLTIWLSVLSIASASPGHFPRATPAPYYNPHTSTGSHGSSWINYTTVPGFFLQDEETTVPSTFDYTQWNFGLLNRTYSTDSHVSKNATQWQKFERYVDFLNQGSSKNVNYKVLFMGRHGEGWHNAAETYYGTPAWNCYYSELDGNATVTWADAHLDPKGIAQAQKASNYWLSRIQLQKIPLPQSYYTSPLYRCLQTSNITFSTLPLPKSRPFKPLIKELFREGISGHTCDRRSNRTSIHESFPSYKIEKGFSENDLLWKALEGEVPTDQDVRSKKVLDEVFGSDENTWLSITSHSGEIASILRVLNHRVFSLVTGAIIPVLVKAETIPGIATSTSYLPWTTISTCTSPPANTATL
ncbi:putative phosphoglycerate mutase pmu1 [Ciborinia camelliae]|nr:putative phosphoglycerate mutase pmu1 [Ciborinia camelliae]